MKIQPCGGWLEKEPNVMIGRKDCYDGYIGSTQEDGSNAFADWVKTNNIELVGKVRSKLVPILKDIEDFVYQGSFVTEEGINLSIHGMRSSKFCLHPARDTPSSCRLFDAIVSHCVPVIASDNIELPYEDELDYTEFSVVFSVQEAFT